MKLPELSEIIEQAEELGKQLKETPQYKELQTAEEDLSDDPQAQILMQSVQQAQQKIQNVQQAGMQPTEDQVQSLNQASQEMNQNAAVMRFLQAKEEFEEILRSVNQSIGEGLREEEEEEEGLV